jgi:hypothetical protein
LLAGVSKELPKQEELLTQCVVMDVVLTPSRFEVFKLCWPDEREWTFYLLEVKLKRSHQARGPFAFSVLVFATVPRNKLWDSVINGSDDMSDEWLSLLQLL